MGRSACDRKGKRLLLLNEAVWLGWRMLFAEPSRPLSESGRLEPGAAESPRISPLELKIRTLSMTIGFVESKLWRVHDVNCISVSPNLRKLFPMHLTTP